MAGALRFVPDVFREFFLLEKAQREASSRSVDQEAAIRDFVTAADARLAAAESLTGGDQVPAALILFREGIVFTIRALLAAHQRAAGDQTVDGVFRNFAELMQAGEVPAAPEGFDAVRALLSDPRPLAFDELPAGEALAKRAQVETAALWLRGLVDTRTVRQIKWSRALRLGMIAVVVLALIGIGIGKLLAPRNLALGKPVQSSSRRANSPPGSGEAGLPPSGLVDGSVGSTYDICTNSEVRPWVMVDLQRVHNLGKVIAYNRADCCQGSYDLPAILELSEDGATFREVARRTTAYSASDPWVIKLDRTPARFIRLRVDANEPRELVLTELEAFGSR